jgi:hypothetical protein
MLNLFKLQEQKAETELEDKKIVDKKSGEHGYDLVWTPKNSTRWERIARERRLSIQGLRFEATPDTIPDATSETTEPTATLIKKPKLKRRCCM